MNKVESVANFTRRAKVIMEYTRARKQTEFVPLSMDVHIARIVTITQGLAGHITSSRSELDDVFTKG